MFPCIGYRDERRASDWLNRAFGFERHAIYEGPDGTIVHAELRLGPGIIMLGRPPEDERGTCFYVYVEDVDAHCERAVAAGAEIVRPLHDTEYGSREYGVRDHEGHLWYFGSYMPAPEEA
jgi:uncharacterized glyoxalase superfamily protein PhnB